MSMFLWVYVVLRCPSIPSRMASYVGANGFAFTPHLEVVAIPDGAPQVIKHHECERDGLKWHCDDRMRCMMYTHNQRRMIHMSNTMNLHSSTTRAVHHVCWTEIADEHAN